MQNRKQLLSNLSVFFCFCLYTGLFKLALGQKQAWPFVLSLLLAFVPPFFLVLNNMADKRRLNLRFRLRALPRGAYALSIRLGLACAALLIFLRLLFDETDISLPLALRGAEAALSTPAKLILFAVLGAVLTELYLRGALLTQYERIACTAPCLMASGLVYALLQGNRTDFVALWVTGAALAYLSYVFGCVWPAVVAAVSGGLYQVLLSWLVDTYAAFGLWRHLRMLNALALLLFLYLALRKAAILIEKGNLPPLTKGGMLYDSWLLLGNVGIFATIVGFLVTAVLRWL